MLIRYRGLGDTAPLNAFTQWRDALNAQLQRLYGDDWRTHGMATRLPANVPATMQQFVGQSAAMLTNDAYVALFNAGFIDPNAPQVAANNGLAVYVVAPPAVQATQPHTMTTGERIANATFTGLDVAADAVGAPSLGGIEDFLKGIGRDILVGAVVTVGIAILLKRKR